MMKNPLRQFFDAIEPLFGEGKPLRPLHPIYDATDNFFFSPPDVTEHPPFVRDGIDIKRFMITVIFALTPIILFSVYLSGPYVLSMILISYACGGMIEFAFAYVRKEHITEGFLVTGILIPLSLPASCPLWVVGVGSAFGVLFGKEVFGGTGHNPLNPAVTGRLFIFLAWPLHVAPPEWPAPLAWPVQAQASTWLDPKVWIGGVPDAVSEATPLTVAIAEGWAPEPGTAWNLVSGVTAGSVGGTSAILIALGGAYLIYTKVANWRPMLSCVLGAYLAGTFMHWLNPAFATGWFHVIAGGFLFAAVFMVTDPVSGPATNPARYVYGFLIGLLIVVGRNLGSFPDWIAFGIILGNLFAPLMDQAVWRYRFRRLRRCRNG